MSRKWGLLVVALALAGCAKATPAPTTTPPPTNLAPPQQPQPPAEAPKFAAPVDGPVYLLAQPEKPLWPGPASVVVENSPQARPQAGLAEADMVVEGLAESEITRTLALFWSKPVAKIGPVRSARTYTVAIAGAYDAPYAHSGGNMDALAVLRQSWGPKNLDEIYGAGQFFWRSTDREPPHNLYTSTTLLGEAVTGRKIAQQLVPTTPRGLADPAAAGETVSRADIDWHRLHKLAWQWDDAGKVFRRFEDGDTPHTMEGGAVITAANLVFLEVTGENNGWELGWSLDLEKGGKATVLTGNHRWEGTWSLGSGGFKLQPAAGKVPPLVPGNVWVHLITQESSFALTK